MGTLPDKVADHPEATHRVIAYDDDGAIEPALFEGTYDECLLFIRNDHSPETLDMINVRTKRHVSYPL